VRKKLGYCAILATVAGAGLWIYGAQRHSPAAGFLDSELALVAQVRSDNSDPTINFRSTPTQGRWREAQNDNLLFSLPGPLQVTVHCIAPDENVDLPSDLRGNWYFVTALDGPYPDASGFVWGLLVKDPGPVPACTDELLGTYKYLPGRLTLTQGAPAEAGGFWYQIRVIGLHAGYQYAVGCFDDADAWGLNAQPPAFRTFDIRTDGSGNWSGDRNCRSGEGTFHWVEIGPYSSERVEWKPQKPTPSATPMATSQTPSSPSSASPRPLSSQPIRRIVVQNQVTNGATAMREDTPVYLSTRTAPYCKRDGCAVPNTDMGTGATLTATCWITGPRMTNGQDGNPIDDDNPGLAVSDLWFFAHNDAGMSGYISEVYIRTADRGGAGLPTC
jgi:hypothetical protein